MEAGSDAFDAGSEDVEVPFAEAPFILPVVLADVDVEEVPFRA